MKYTPSDVTNDILMSKERPNNIMNRRKDPLSTQVGGDHYKQFKIQPIEFCQLNKLPPCESNVIKYICRHRHKDGITDLEKAKHYIDIILKLEYNNESARKVS